ncbi:hypothetical protein K461DRAFT_269631 [Myriangium duriaei CBS 260.36]|uniref:Uncharacterized protein n=1 Tax=Myriangium duriaei CBS 260.36 TaxID=1168546 RepID=A0A9P4MIT8_9PEZI|nr:hypothetical protein K461DRAFT_269631 [Myriangium duriaei CBS 260.36]
MTGKEKQADFSFETVAVLCSALLTSNMTVSTKQYELMSALDGTRTANSFQHQFRAVLKRAKELKALNESGEKTTPVKGIPRPPKNGATPKKAGPKKRDRAAVKDEDEIDAEHDTIAGLDAAELPANDENVTKRVKLENVDVEGFFTTTTMQSLRRAPTQARLASRSLARQQPRRYAHDSHGAHHDAHPAPANESFGKGFFIALAAVPLSIAAYQFTASGGKPWFTRLIEGYTASDETWNRRNDLHVQAVELAGRDKALFFNGSGQVSRTVDVRFPEAINSASPFNVQAGHGHSSIEDAIAKYEKLNHEENAKRLQNLKDGNIRSEKPYDPLRSDKPYKELDPARHALP